MLSETPLAYRLSKQKSVVSASTFYKLPVELLTIIAQGLTEEEDWLEEGKALRLTHPHFADMDNLEAYLFHNVNFHATPEGLARLKTRLPAEIKPFVRQITFLPSTYSTSLNFLNFRRIVIKHWADSTLPRAHFAMAHDYARFVEEQWDKDPPFSREDVFVEYQEYHRQAVAAEVLLTDGSLQVWTDTIKQLPDVETFKYGESQPDLPTSQYTGSPLKVCTISPSHPHDSEHHKQSICRLDQARMQARLVEPASKSINDASARPKALILTSAIVAITPDAPLLPDLQTLDFTRLRSLSWEKHLYEDSTDLSARKTARNDFLLALLRKCSYSLQDLTLILSEEFRHCRSLGGIRLLTLRRLYLGGPIHPRRLPLWVASLPKVERLDIRGVSNECVCTRGVAKGFPKGGAEMDIGE